MRTDRSPAAFVTMAAAVCLLVLAPCVGAQTAPAWTNSSVLSLASDWNNAATAIKEPQIVPAKGGGFHVAYWAGGVVRYRRINPDGTAGASTLVYQGSFVPNTRIGEAADGTVAVTWENWNQPAGPVMGVRRLTNAGAPISGAQFISTNGDAKFPHVTGVGTSGGQVLGTYWNPSNKDLRQLRFDGTSWGGDTYLGQDANNEYVATGQARSPLDGSVWRAWGVATPGSTWGIRMARFDASTNTWSAPIEVVSNKTGFISRISLDVTSTGKVMLAWDSANSTTGRIYNPATASWGGELPLWGNKSFFGNVAAVPGTDNFYVFNTFSQDFPMVRPIINGVLDPVQYLAEYPGGNSSFGDYVPNIRGAVDENGRAVAVWEQWNNVNPQMYWSMRVDPLPVPEPASLGVLALLACGAASRRCPRRGYNARPCRSTPSAQSPN